MNHSTPKFTFDSVILYPEYEVVTILLTGMPFPLSAYVVKQIEHDCTEVGGKVVLLCKYKLLSINQRTFFDEKDETLVNFVS